MLKFAKPLAGLFLFVAFVASFLLTPVAVMAQTPTPENQGPAPINIGGSRVDAESVSAAIDSPTPNLANTTAYVLYTILVVMCRSFGDAQACKVGQGETASAPGPTYASNKPENVSQAVGDHGLIGGLGFLTAELISNPPVSAQAYVADVAAGSRFAPQQAYAQGFGLGFGALSPILGTWKAFRDVAYYLLTIVFLIVGFLILIRHKVSGNVAVTVQNALPRLVITLILITFSYAIAGFVVDAMFLAIYFLINMFQNQIFSSSYSAREVALNTHFFQFIFDFIFSSTGAWRAAEALGSVAFEAFRSALDGITGNATSGDSLGFLRTIISIIFMLIFAVALIISMFRTFFQLIMSYAGFVVNVVLSPFILLGGAIPGKGDAFAGWLKNLIAGLAPFVVVIFMIFMATALTGGDNTQDGIGYETIQEGADGAQIEGLRLPLILTGSVNSNAVVGILAMGILLMIPEAVGMTKKMIGAKDGPFDQFKDSALKNLKEGWTGNKYVPGARKITGAALTGAAGGGIAGGTAGSAWAQKNIAGKNAPQAVKFATGVAGGLIGGTFGALGVGTLGAAYGAGSTVIDTGVKAYKKVQPAVKNVNEKGGDIRDKLFERSNRDTLNQDPKTNKSPDKKNRAV
jgi:hypothetical protein